MCVLRTLSSVMSSSSREWDACVRHLSSDRAVLDILLRGARRRYDAQFPERTRLDPTRRAEAWQEAVRDVSSHLTEKAPINNFRCRWCALRSTL